MSQRDGRRVKSTGDEAEPDGANLSQPLQRRREGEEGSMFYAKPERARKHRLARRAVARNAGNGMERRFRKLYCTRLNIDLDM